MNELIEAAERLLDLHRRAGNVPVGEQANEAEIVDGIIDLLVVAGLVDRTQVRREADRVDIRTDDLIIEVKKRIGIGLQPNSDHVAQLDRYLSRARQSNDPERLGILTDGKYWVLRLPGIEEVRTHYPYGFQLNSSAGANDLVAWLQDETQALPSMRQSPRPAAIEEAFGSSFSAETFINDLTRLYENHRSEPTVIVKKGLWHNLLAAALGEVINDEADLDRLFVRHTYLSTIVALAVQAAFGVDIRKAAANQPAELINGDLFIKEVGIRGVIESDFFGWPAETDVGCEWIVGLTHRVAKFEWDDADYDTSRVLYQTIISSEDRKRLGEYYTPDWLATAIIEEVVDDPLNQKVLDPACGSGTFLRAAINHYISKAEASGLNANQMLSGLRDNITGIDTHPVAVHLARATWVLAAKKVVSESDDVGSLTVPVYLGDSLQLHSDPGSIFGGSDVTIEIKPDRVGGRHRFLHFPKRLVAQGDRFDELMLKAAENIEAGLDPTGIIENVKISDSSEQETLRKTLQTLVELHAEGRNHIWAYYTRNLVRPVWLSTREGKVNRIVGNPPWLTYRQTEATIRDELERQSKNEYGIWAGGKYAPHQDMAGLFYTRSLDLYLREGGRVGMVLPHSVLIGGQYEKWRTGVWGGIVVNLSKVPWDLERIEPNTFFPVPACVAFADKGGLIPVGLSRTTERWLGPEGGPNTKEMVVLTASREHDSPYSERAKQGATIVPRLLFFVDLSEATASLAKDVVRVSPMRSSREKQPWKDLNPLSLSGPIEDIYIHQIHLGDTVTPFVFLKARHAVLPLRNDEMSASGPGVSTQSLKTDPTHLEYRMRSRWRDMNSIWDTYKSSNNNLTLIEQLDYRKKLSSQLRYQPIRLVYTTSGRPTAAVLEEENIIIDCRLFWLACDTLAEAHYLAAIINSKALYESVIPMMSQGQYGARDLHKHLWNLPIYTYDSGDFIHRALATSGAAAADRAAEVLAEEEQARAAVGKEMTVTVARRVIRAWLDESDVGRAIEAHVEELLSG